MKSGNELLLNNHNKFIIPNGLFTTFLIVALQENKETGYLNADIDSAQYVDTTAEPISSDSSEWKLIESEPPILSKALAAIHCTLQEIHQLPAGASGKLAILEVSSFDTPDGMKIDSIPTTLFQTTFDSVGPGPNPQDWRFKLRDY